MTDDEYIQNLREKANAATSRDEREQIQSMIDRYCRYKTEREARYLQDRNVAKVHLTGTELENVLRRLDEEERLQREEDQAEDNPHEMRRILTKRLNDLKKRRHELETQSRGKEWDKALKFYDRYQKNLEERIDELKIYENPLDHFPVVRRPGLLETNRLLRKKKNGTLTPEEKSELFNTIKNEQVLKNAITIKIQRDPIYRQKIISEYRKRKLKFNMLSIFLLVCIPGIFVLLSHTGIDLSDEFIIKIICLTIFLIFYTTYWYIGNKIWRCPVCDYQLDFLGISKRNCPKCGTPFK